MSLLNDVLRDLDKRESAPRTPVPHSLQKASPGATRRWPGVLALALVTAGLAGGYWWMKAPAEPPTPVVSQVAMVNTLSARDEKPSAPDHRIETPSEVTELDTPVVAEVAPPVREIAPQPASQAVVAAPQYAQEPARQTQLKQEPVVIVEDAPLQPMTTTQKAPSTVKQESPVLSEAKMNGANVDSEPKEQARTAPAFRNELEEAHAPLAVAPEPAAETPATLTRHIDIAATPAEEAAPSSAAMNIAPSQTPEAIAARALQQARESYRQGEVEAARQRLRDLLTSMPEHEASRYQLATWLIGAGDYPQALQVMQSVDAYSSVDFKLMKARTLAATGMAAQAIALLESEAPKVEAAPDYHSLLAGLYHQARRYEDAIATYAALIEAHPHKGDWWAGLGIALDQTGRSQSALQAYRQAVGDPELQTTLAQYASRRIQQLEPGGGGG
ncbi:tetratricopeptide repeat protein [Hahella sp. KA22]|uniref:tetratricopeptide repeat protein n=1 Tax=Hahella sp. KA22 TaxID=1628392 RepID=UPI000FDD74A6|nr:tetratricopeptide repeat protein [Hahella sp. KA22]AZZ94557.1 tetratricopeptide repeat protein [Hahella sp. KA22]QAY57930.1 tetratricopeptide repeat protein [Hahella sp. KA22]